MESPALDLALNKRCCDPAVRPRILDDNEDDCRATRILLYGCGRLAEDILATTLPLPASASPFVTYPI